MLIVAINAIIAGFIAGTGVVLAQMANGGSVMPTKATWLVAALTGLANACKDWQSHMTMPPIWPPKE